MVSTAALFFLLGCFFLFLLTVVVYRTGLVHRSRDQAGQLRKKQTPAGVLTLAAVFVLIVSFFVLFQAAAFDRTSGFPEMIAWTFALMLALVLFDSLVIDLLLIGKIRPRFLRLPEETTMETMKTHVRKTFTFGWAFIASIILLSSVIAYLLLH